MSALDRIYVFKKVAIRKEQVRNYKAEYRDYHGQPEQIKERAQRNAARSDMGLDKGDPREVDHKKPISAGGSNSKRNLRAVSQDTNRKKGASVHKDGDWSEGKHPRAANGQFGSGGSSSSGKGKEGQGAKHKRNQQARRAADHGQQTLGGTGAIQSLLTGGSALDKLKVKEPDVPKAEPGKGSPATFEEIAGKSPDRVNVNGIIDHTKPYIIRVSGKTPDHSKKLTHLSSLGFKWGNDSKTWYKGIEPGEGEDTKAALLDHIDKIGAGAKSPLTATLKQGAFKKPATSSPSSGRSTQSTPTVPASKPFPSHPDDGKPGAVPAHELGSLLTDIDEMENEIIRHDGRRDWEPDVKLSAPIPELKRKIEEGRAKLKEGMDRLTSKARYEVLSEHQYNKIKPGRRSGPTKELRELGEKGGLYKK
jgi:hypothetical protein